VTEEGLKAWRAVLPRDVPVLPVGGIVPANMASWVAAGAQGFGIGSALYAPGIDLHEITRRAHAFAQAWVAISENSKDVRA
jgi:2-dehydro-3-deoxyphosphogalactonate aldolase